MHLYLDIGFNLMAFFVFGFFLLTLGGIYLCGKALGDGLLHPHDI
jgi:hypothetical protein